MNSHAYRYLCLFALLLAQFVYPPQNKSQSPSFKPDFVGQYDQGKSQGNPIGQIDRKIVCEYSVDKPQ